MVAAQSVSAKTKEGRNEGNDYTDCIQIVVLPTQPPNSKIEEQE